MASLVTRNLTILLTDIKGFTDKTSHKSRVEIQTLLDRHKEVVLPVLEERGGRLVKTMGDAFLATFESPTNAVLAGIEAQAALANYNVGRKAEDKIEIRVAINQGEVNVSDNDIFGEPVNITARIEAVADAGDVFFTEAIYLAMNKKEVPSSEVGLLQLKGIPEKVRVYRVKSEHPVESMGSAADYSAERPAEKAPASATTVARAAPAASSAKTPAVMAAAAIAFAAAAAFYFHRSAPSSPAASAPIAFAPAPSAPSVSAPAASLASGSIAARVGSRKFPSIFLGWERPGKKNADPLARTALLARHDLIFAGPYTFGLKWRGSPEGLSEEFTPESVAAALTLRRDILSRNPNAVLLLEVRYRDYADADLPPDHAWWRRGPGGGHVQAWKAGWSELDYHLPALQDHVAAQCAAAVRSGAVDGCMFNAWDEDDDRLALLKKVRAAAGDDALLLVSSGKQLPLSAPFVNGEFLDMSHDLGPKTWGNFERTMVWAQSNLREPRLVCLSVDQPDQRADLMRLATTLSLTHSDGYAYFGQPPGGGEGWSDEWPPFWDKKLGRPLSFGQPRDDGSTSREFEGGTAVYNPPGGKKAKLDFAEPRTSAATGKKGKSFSLAAGDGDLYLK